ncbi:hypothetical protein A1O3_10260 [Capronia epimyces CBS 606.96]|uniref:Uncharacterized protein n=1 Tax=Capronia epimyces CBS 606.96 TaxID=1182542 RepID=W9X9F4_9EURO|nr:uncharacterized protein A1O3_10260 [Capronia epimyces CBS 606.96]EXJ77102.1 hypothetical protein A1O3_10260 [Capronia epimyces CBS 606.96]
MTDAASIRSTSTMSSLKALLPSTSKNSKSNSEKKEKSRPKAETVEQRAVKWEARGVYMSLR